MDHAQFSIGTEFRCGEGLFRCTDVGNRTVIAIGIDKVEISTVGGETVSRAVLRGKEADGDGWFNGPPYAVLETVFDEYDLEGCEPA